MYAVHASEQNLDAVLTLQRGGGSKRVSLSAAPIHVSSRGHAYSPADVAAFGGRAGQVGRVNRQVAAVVLKPTPSAFLHTSGR